MNDAGIQLAKTMVETAEVNLSYCVITAPCDGYASRKLIQEGQLVQPGQTLLDIVDASDIWVTANFKETQLAHITPGSRVSIKVDAIPDVSFSGEVVSISQATGGVNLDIAARQLGRQFREGAPEDTGAHTLQRQELPRGHEETASRHERGM